MSNPTALTKSCEHTELRRAKTGGWFCADRIDCEFTIPEPGLGLLETVRDALRHGGRATRERAAVLVDEAMSARLRAPGPVTSKQQLVTELRKLHTDIVECDEGRESPMMTLVRRAADALESSPETSGEHICGSPTAACDADCMERAARADDGELIERVLSLLGSGRCEYEGCVQGAYPSARDGEPVPCMWHDERAVVSRLLRLRFPLKSGGEPA